MLSALSGGPLTAFELVGAVSAQAPELFEDRAGLVFPVLLGLRRQGRLTSEWTDAADGRRNLHRPAGTPTGIDAVQRPAPHIASPHLAAAADRATRRLAFAPRLAGEFRTDVLHYLADASAAARANGDSPQDADRRALREFGDPWKVDADLARIAEGRRAIVFSAGIADTLAGVVIYDLRALLVIVAAIVFVRVQVVTAYHIPSKSMEPTLHGDPRRGDRILVNKLAGPPGRFDITVFDGFGTDRKNFVKRCIALPGEKLSLGEGDIWIDGKLVRKDGDVYEALLFDVFDRDRERRRAGPGGLPPTEARYREEIESLWRFEGDGECGVQEDRSAPFAGFRLSVRGGDDVTLPGRNPPQLVWHRLVEDTYMDAETGDPHAGVHNVPDQRITFSVKPVAGTGSRVTVAISRGKDHEYSAVLLGTTTGVSLFADGVEVARDESALFREGVPTIVSFSVVDRVLRLTVADRLVLRHDLPAPEFPKRSAPAGTAMIRVLRGAAWIDPIRLERDVYYVPDGPDDNFTRLGPDQFFMMGDNSSNSSDSRTHGPVHKSRLIGSPLLVVWPPSRLHVPR